LVVAKNIEGRSKIDFSDLACIQIWQSLPIDDCHRGYFTKIDQRKHGAANFEYFKILTIKR
jgi:hypothetical protein